MATQFFVHFQALVHWIEAQALVHWIEAQALAHWIEAQALAHWIKVQTQIKICETPNDFLLLIHCIISH